VQAFFFAGNITFNLAHLFFAFAYLALSYRLELIAKKLPEDTYNCRFNTVNVIASLLNVAVSAIVWIYTIKREPKAEITAYFIE
jgi:hypothetical protein